ncbi:16969_t:CDS:2, partial [Gigaspora rosea]
LDIEDINNNSLVVAENNNENIFGEMFEDIEMVNKDVFEKSDEMVDDEELIDLSITNNSR